MRSSLLTGAALFAAIAAAPAAAQDHSGHGEQPDQSGHAQHNGSEAQEKAEAVDHCAMGHLPPEQCPPKKPEAAAKDPSQHSQTPPADHAGMDHSDHGAKASPDTVDHCAMGHLPPEQCPPKKPEAAATDPSQQQGMDHSRHGSGQMDHSQHDTGQASMDHSQHGGGAMDKSAPGAAPETAVPARAFEGPRHAADAIWGEEAMRPARTQLARENGDMKTGMVMFERLEARIPTEGGDTGYVWDAQGWYGGDINRFVLKTEGEGEFGGEVEDAEIQALFSRAIGPFFDLQAGVRFDPAPDSRSHLVLGVQGLAPYMFHVDGALFLSDEGDLTARIEAEYDQKITQSLILQPRIEVEASAQDIPAREIGAGLTKIEPGVRLRYEIEREFAPYIGIEYESKLGETADIARASGEDAGGFKLLVGLRAWF